MRLRNININGTGASGTVGTRTGLVGINIISAANVILEDMLVTQFTQFGIRDARNGSGVLAIKDTVVRDNGGPAIAIAPTTGAVAAIIDNSHANISTFGLAVGNGNRVMVNRSVFMGNTTAGVEADPGGNLTINNSVMSQNSTGVTASAGSTVRLSNNDITFNSTGISGTTLSYGNNRLLGNTSAGTAPTPAGPVSNEFAQQ